MGPLDQKFPWIGSLEPNVSRNSVDTCTWSFQGCDGGCQCVGEKGKRVSQTSISLYFWQVHLVSVISIFSIVKTLNVFSGTNTGIILCTKFHLALEIFCFAASKYCIDYGQNVRLNYNIWQEKVFTSYIQSKHQGTNSRDPPLSKTLLKNWVKILKFNAAYIKISISWK